MKKTRKLWLAVDVPGQLSALSGVHLFEGTAAPDFDEGVCQANDECDYMGEVSSLNCRGAMPKPGTCCEVVIMCKGGE